jgi:hypothetical protein
MQTISTKYLGPTNTKPSRIISRASSSPGSVTINVDHSRSIEDNHAFAARRLMEKLGWKGRLVGGHTKNGMCWVFTSEFINVVYSE